MMRIQDRSVYMIDFCSKLSGVILVGQKFSLKIISSLNFNKKLPLARKNAR
jgi:hypothetical protein